MIRRPSADPLGFLVLGVVITLLFADVIFAGSGFYIRDLFQYYFPTKHVIRDMILSGHLPVWNPFYAAGQPMAANPEYEVFYPLQALVLLPDYELGFQLHILLHLYIAAFGAYALLRAFGRGMAASIFGALLFSLGGPMLSLVNLLPMLFCVAWIPWIILSVHALTEQPTRRRFALASLVIGIQMLAAEPSTLIQTWALIVLYLVWRAIYVARPRVLPALGALAGGLAIGAVQMLPAIDHVRDSVRSRPFPFDVATSWSMPPLRLIEMALPRFFGPLTDRGLWYWGSSAYPKDGAPFLFSVYSSALLIPLLIAGLRTRSRGLWLGAGWSLAAILAAFGSHAPVFGWIRHLPLMASIRYPEKFFLTFVMLATFYAAIVFDRLVSGDDTVRRWTGAVLVLFAVIAAAGAVACRTDIYASGFFSLWHLNGHPLAQQMLAISRAQWLRPAVAFAGFAMMIGLMRFLELRRWSMIAIGLVVVDVGLLAQEVAPRMPHRFFERPAIVSAIAQRPGRLFHEAQRDTQSPDAVRYTRLGEESYWTGRNALLPMTPARWGIPMALEVDYDSTFLIPSDELLTVIGTVSRQRSDWRSIFGPMSNVTTRAAYRPFARAAADAAGNVEQMVPVDIFPSASNGQFYFADEVVTARSAAEVAQALVKGNWSARVAFWPAAALRPSEGKVLRIAETPARIAVDVEAAGDSVLVSSTTFHKYWRATIDGAAVPIQRTNVAYQAVRVPAGRHAVVFTYRNEILLGSMIISGVAGLVCLMMLVGRGRRPGEWAR